MIPRLATRLGSFHETMAVIPESFTATASPSASGATQQDKVEKEKEEEEEEEEDVVIDYRLCMHCI